MRRLLPVVLVLLVASTASAGPKSRKTAKLASGIASGVSGAVTLTGFVTAPSGEAFNMPVLYTGIGMLFITPSAGEFYSGQYLTWGLGIRAAATGLAIYTLQTQTKDVVCDVVGANHDPNCKSFTENAYPLLGVAAIAFIGGVWYDVLDAGDSADRYNARHGFTITPAPMAGPQGTVPGLMLSGSF